MLFIVTVSMLKYELGKILPHRGMLFIVTVSMLKYAPQNFPWKFVDWDPQTEVEPKSIYQKNSNNFFTNTTTNK